MRKILIFLLFILFSSIHAQQPVKLNSSQVFKEIQKLNFLGSVLYIAAHPDDENTRLISYLSNELNARTAYLSLTRGDGGQNLIGSELREQLGIIRTQELLAARKIDGGEQLFTRANDFGYSKHPEETLRIWNKEEVLNDVVWAIRKFKPDVIINRFHHQTAGETHGHHTASALLSLEAFNLAGEKSVFPVQLENVEVWSPKKLFFNTSPWFYGSQKVFEDADKSNFLELDIGVYFPLLGVSNTEIAALSRSQHRSQGFGSTGTRGDEMEYIELITGGHGQNASLFKGINTTWSRIEGGKPIGEILTEVEKAYDFKDPAASIPQLVQAYELLQNLEDEFWKKTKSKEIKEIIAACAGLYLEAVAQNTTATRGEKITVNLEVINRSEQDLKLISAEVLPVKKIISAQNHLKNNESWKEKITFLIPESASYTSPYWLKEKGSLGMYKVEDLNLIGLPETPREFRVSFVIDFMGTHISFNKEIVYKRNDTVKGEVYQAFEIVPEISAGMPENVTIFANEDPKIIPISLKAAKEDLQGTLKLEHQPSWKVSPESYQFDLQEKGEEKTFFFTVTPPTGQEESILSPLVEIDGKAFEKEITTIDYEHTPFQTAVLPSETKVVKLEFAKKGELIAYIEGAGDLVPESLEQIGYKVVKVDPGKISAKNLKEFDAVVMGIRAYNILDELKYKQKELLEYVKEGGNLIIQYNTNRGIDISNLAPYPLQLSRDRVTDEEAEVRFLAEDHPVLNTPNKITQKDFEGWVQERGLYFPDEWSIEFTPILSMNDPGESPKNGSLLIAPYGKGNYIYTGLSFFREFPAGVSGAFRLFANMISLEENDSSSTLNLKNKS